MSNAKPKTIEHKVSAYGRQTGGHMTTRQMRQLRRTENHLQAWARKQETLRKRKRSEAAKKAAATRALKKKLREQGVEFDDN